MARPADWLEIVAGLRFDSFKLDVDDLRGSGSAENPLKQPFEPGKLHRRFWGGWNKVHRFT